MKPPIIFFIIIFVFFSAVNYYICYRGWQALALPRKFNILYFVICTLLVFSFPLAMLLRDKIPVGISPFTEALGSTWIAVMLFAFIFIYFIDLLRIVNHFFPFFPDFITHNIILTKRVLFATALLFISTVLLIGNRNYRNPETTRLQIVTDKNLGADKELNILFFSDFHLTGLFSEQRLREYVEMMNREEYDLVLIGGDLLDGDNRMWEKNNFATILHQLTPKYGIYACMGNHEYYNGIKKIENFYTQSGITLLRDGVISIGDSSNIILVSRDDRTNTERQSIENLLKSVDKEHKFIITLDHQPKELAQASQNGVDLLLCGHTHDGQIFPISLIIRKMWEVAYGHEKLNNMDIYVTSGLGLWGPPIRLGTTSELVRIKIKEK